MRNSWLYFARRSPRQHAPDLICPVARPTVRSAIKSSVVSPDLWLVKTPHLASLASLTAYIKQPIQSSSSSCSCNQCKIREGVCSNEDRRNLQAFNVQHAMHRPHVQYVIMKQKSHSKLALGKYCYAGWKLVILRDAMFSAYTLKHSAVGVQLTSSKQAATLASSTLIATIA